MFLTRFHEISEFLRVGFRWHFLGLFLDPFCCVLLGFCVHFWSHLFDFFGFSGFVIFVVFGVCFCDLFGPLFI